MLPLMLPAQATQTTQTTPATPATQGNRGTQAAEAPPPISTGPVDSSLRAQYIRSHYTKFEYRIPMRDGKHLFTSVYVPNDASEKKRYPILFWRTPYAVSPYGVARYKSTLSASAGYEKEGFIFVFQDVRGTHMSEGEFVNMRPMRKDKLKGIDESTDAWDSIDWMVKNLPHNNGKVGQLGISYPGFYTSAAAIDSHPALKAVSPQAPIADWFRGDDMHRNGAFNLQMSFGFFSEFGKPRTVPAEPEDPPPFAYGTPDAYQFYLDLGPLSNANTRYLKDNVPFWKEITEHPNYDAFWQERNILPHLKNIKAAVLTVGGWYDTEDLYGPLQTYAAIEKQNPGIQNTLVIGPWTHGGWSRGTGERVGDADFGFKTSEGFIALEFAFFKHHLKDAGKDATKDTTKGAANSKLPEAWMFETGANRWRSFDAWPPREAKSKALYLQAGGQLAFQAPATQGHDEYLSDPAKPVPYTTEISTRWSRNYMAADQRFAAQRPDVLVYQTEVLDRDITLAGPLEAELFVSTTGSDADFIVKLIDVNPSEIKPDTSERSIPMTNRERQDEIKRGGQQTLVRGEPVRARFRDSLSEPKALVPNQPTKIQFAINDVLHTFKRGHRIMIQIQSSWFPFIDRNPQTFMPSIYEARAEDFVKATHKVYREPGQASRLQVRVLPGLDE
jgi:uncharacterized protein